MARSYLVITDSGGVQEEAPALGIPVLLVRDTTERPEGIKCGSVKIVGTNETDVYNNLNTILDDPQIHKCMSESICPFGDGKASERISDILERVILE